MTLITWQAIGLSFLTAFAAGGWVMWGSYRDRKHAPAWQDQIMRDLGFQKIGMDYTGVYKGLPVKIAADWDRGTGCSLNLQTRNPIGQAVTDLLAALPKDIVQEYLEFQNCTLSNPSPFAAKLTTTQDLVVLETRLIWNTRPDHLLFKEDLIVRNQSQLGCCLQVLVRVQTHLQEKA